MTRAARPWLWPLAPAYRLALALREVQLRTGFMRVRRLQLPVVSVGSLSAGGAGKTPLTIALARALTARGVHVDVLSRGYGRRRSAVPLLVEPGGTAGDFGDEPLMIAREAQAPVYVADERYEAGLMSERSAPQGFGLHLLDDGFQHRQLARDVDILLLSCRDLEDHLLPVGNLREALRAADRANVFAIPVDEPEVAAWLKNQGWGRQIWRLQRHMEVPQINGPIVAFCGIARPEQFFDGLERGGVRAAARVVFADHYLYTARDLERLAAAAQKAGASALLTTAKDRARLGALASVLPASLPLQSVPLRIEIEDEAAALAWLLDRLRAPGGISSNNAHRGQLEARGRIHV